MKVLISADMEGVCGVTSWVQVMPPELGQEPSSTVEYERARLRMTREVNAAIEGAFEAGADEVIVNDSHDGMRNLIPEELHTEVRFISGSDKELGMMQGLQEKVHAAFYVGYHAKAGTPAAPLAHTWTGYVNDVRINGESTGEFGLNALIAGHFDVPVVLATGDDKAVAQVKAYVGKQVQGVVVKEGYSTFSAIHLHPTKAQRLIKEGAKKALSKLSDAKPKRLSKKSKIELEFDHQSRADQCLYIPGIKRAGERAVSFVASDALEMNQIFRALIKASRVQMSP
ncbi:MAG: M55 family metallopeptidase [Trueperaceae bacterium]|nr:M55 family metallopeptidase [Trueperaceae bacterium]